MTLNASPYPFSSGLWKEINQLLKRLDSRQTLWLGHFLSAQSGIESNTRSTGAAMFKALIVFGGETGNSEGLARHSAAQAGVHGISVSVASLANMRIRQLGKCDYLFVICSTHGDGEPPEPARRFYEELMSEDAPECKSLRYSVLALGDSSYEQFCAIGRRIDTRLSELGAKRIVSRQDCDVDYEKPAQMWIDRILDTLPRNADHMATSRISEISLETQPIFAAVEYSKRQPLTVTVLENVCLSARHRQSPIHHLELALGAANFQVNPGDAVGVLVDNPSNLVRIVLDVTGLSAEQQVSINGETTPLVTALRKYCDLTVPGNNFLEFWASISGSDELRQQVAADKKTQRQYLRRYQIRDLITRFPARPSAEDLVANLRPLQPRLYDVANSQVVIDDELHLTVKHYQYNFFERKETGIASDYLVQLKPGHKLRIYPHRNARFQLPDDFCAPIILVAEGTGIAPYRAFLQEINATARTNPCWLVFTEQCFEDDFLYQLEWQEAHHSGVLQCVDAVFDRNQPHRSLCDVLFSRSDQLISWITNDAHFYLCGDKELLIRCEKDLQELFNADACIKNSWEQLVKSKRIHRNLY